MRDLTIAALDDILCHDVDSFSIDGDGTFRFQGEAIPDRVFEGLSREAHVKIITYYKDQLDEHILSLGMSINDAANAA